MSRRGYARRPDSSGTDRNGMTAEDRAAARNYQTRRFGGGLVSQRYRQDLSEITNSTPAPKSTDPEKNK